MDKTTKIWEVYRTCWNIENSEERKSKLTKIMTDDFEYCDPNIKLKGSYQLSDYMGQFQKEFSGISFIVTNLQLHHERSLANWNMVTSENEIVGNGTDFAQYENGKLKQITGFFKEN